MQNEERKSGNGRWSRRDFVKTTGVASIAVVSGLGVTVNNAHAQGSDKIRVGVIGCGGRGGGAADDCVKSSAGVEIVALADAFEDRLNGLKNKFKVPDNRCFAGLDAYKKLLTLDDINLVIMATPPAFRPPQLAAAIAAGKNVFMEKPVAVCPAGVKMVIEASAQAKQKGLAIVAGTQRRHEQKYIETIKRIQDGAIGDIVSAQCYWNMGGLWHDRVKENWANYQSKKYSDVEWQIRNWLFTIAYSGDHICEQHVHNLDIINWAFNDLPEQVHGVGGRQYRTGPEWGNVNDHFGVEFFYPGDIRTISMCRQIDGAADNVSERVAGTKGSAKINEGVIEGENAWKYDGPNPNPYEEEHKDLIASIRKGEPLNEGQRIAESTLCAIMGRESAYSRQQFKRSWFESRCTLDLIPPDELKLSDSAELPAFAIPGQYQLPGLAGGDSTGARGGGRKKKK